MESSFAEGELFFCKMIIMNNKKNRGEQDWGNF